MKKILLLAALSAIFVVIVGVRVSTNHPVTQPAQASQTTAIAAVNELPARTKVATSKSNVDVSVVDNNSFIVSAKDKIVRGLVVLESAAGMPFKLEENGPQISVSAMVIAVMINCEQVEYGILVTSIFDKDMKLIATIKAPKLETHSIKPEQTMYSVAEHMCKTAKEAPKSNKEAPKPKYPDERNVRHF